MKQVFFVHSQITKLISFSIISNLSLNQKDIVIITYRGCNFYDGYKTYAFPFSHYPVESFPLQKNFLSSRAQLKKLDYFLDKITENNDYVLYLPQVNERMFELMVSHHKCAKYNLIEEGKLSFTELDRRKTSTYSKKEYILLKLNYGNRLSKKRTYLPDTYDSVFKFSDAAFPDYDRVKKINLYHQEQSLDYQNVLVLEPLVEAGIISEEQYLIGLDKVIKLLGIREIKTIHYKFHPDQQKDKSQKSISNFFEKYVQISFIPIQANISLEEIAINSKANFYSISSSMLYYAKVLGSHSYCFLALMPESKKLKDYFEFQPKTFKENLNYIKALETEIISN